MIEVVSLGRRTVRLRPSLARGASSIATIATGGSEGREGPIIQIGAAFASALARRWKVSPERVRILTACGMAAGVAGAYNTPIAATLFVLEVVVGSFSMALFGPAVVSAVVSTIVVRAVLGDEPVYRMAPFRPESLVESLPYAAIGLIGGCASAFFARVLSAGKRIFKATGLPVWATMAIGGALVGAIAIGMPQVYGNGFEATNEILHGNPTLLFLVLLLLAKAVATTATIGSGGVGGVFTPSLLIGAAIGGAVAKIVQVALPHLAAPVGGYALLGMGGMLAGMTRAPLLAVIMIFELTQNTAVLLPMMVVSVLAVAAARLFQKESMYIESLRSAGIVWEKTPEATALASLKVADIMRRDVALVPRTTTLPEIVAAFLRSRSLFLYVGDAEGRLEGAVDIHNIKESFTESELSQARDRGGPRDRDPLRDSGGAADVGQREALVPRHGTAAGRGLGGRAQVPRCRHAARSAGRVRRRGPEAQPPARARADGRRSGRGGLPRAARKAPVDRGGRPRVDRRPHDRGGGAAVPLRSVRSRREAADAAGSREAVRSGALRPLRARRRARRARQRGRHRAHPRRLAAAPARRFLTGGRPGPAPHGRCYPETILDKLDKDRQALLAKEKQSELVALRGKWFKERTRLYDRETGLPTVAVLVDDLKKQLEELGSISVLVFRPSSEGAVEEVWGWEAYDDLLLDFVRRLKAFQTDGIVPGGTLCLPYVRSDEIILFINADGGGMVEGPTALGQKAAELDQLIRGYLAERADVSARFRSFVGSSRIMKDPKHRIERLLYRGVQDARDQVTRKTVRAEIRGGQLLQDVISRQDIRPVFQPVFDLATGNMIGMEALSRGPRGSEFESGESLFSLADRTELLLPLERVCRQRALEAAAPANPKRQIFMNLSPAAASDPEFLGPVFRDQVRSLGLEPDRIVLEITERTYAVYEGLFREVLSKFRSQNFRIAVDDVGTGYSNLSSLADIEPDYLKFDNVFVRGIDRSRSSRTCSRRS